MFKRKWNTWLPRAKEKLDTTSSLLGVSTVVLMGIGGFVGSSAIGLVAGCFGAVTIIHAGFKGFPERLLSPKDMVGKRLSHLEDLDKLSERIPRIGIVGSSTTGKTTLVEKLLRNEEPPDPTNAVYIAILRSGGTNPKIFALIDGAGEEFPQQFSVAEASDVLLLVCDHNESETEAAVVQSRKEEHLYFVRQLASYIENRDRPKRVVILLNKHDNWSRSINAQDFLKWGEELKVELAHAVSGNSITVRKHSNWNVDCINSIWNDVEEATE